MAKRAQFDFKRNLVLSKWALSLFGAETMDDLAESLQDPDLEKLDGENRAGFIHVLSLKAAEGSRLTEEVLFQYDRNIYKHTIRISKNRPGQIRWKYFQYLSLIVTEIYLDRYFQQREQLLKDLNEQVQRHNQQATKVNQVVSFVEQDLRKLGYWMATGSGKTLLMHMHILQFRHYHDKHGRASDLNRIILLTPNPGLSRQHLEEFQKSGMEADLFQKDCMSLFAGKSIEILNVQALKEEGKVTSVAVEAFEANNLVLVDEGHRGTGSKSDTGWKTMREKLSAEGFAFEYSATFGQAINAAKDSDLEQEYAKCILFDYSYAYFYEDGYGKDYRILNLPESVIDQHQELYLTACLMGFYQQQRLFLDHRQTCEAYLLEKPLLVFVGKTVSTSSNAELTDIQLILGFLGRFVNDRPGSTSRIQQILSGHTGLRSGKDQDLFANAFDYLKQQIGSHEDVYSDMLRVLFNAPTTGLLHVENMKGTDGEIALHVGNAETFGLINVGDANKLCKACENQNELVVTTQDFGKSLFETINAESSSINLLIGSKKFTEGWNSWRVCTMGLMNIGRSEGSEIIQLFGRGVRLKGYEWSLMRSGARYARVKQPPLHIRLLETLNIFGIRADYMAEFKDYLLEEGAPVNENTIQFILPVVIHKPLPKLKGLALPEEIGHDGFRRVGRKPVLDKLDSDYFIRRNVTLDWYPRVQVAVSKGAEGTSAVVEKHKAHFTAAHLAFINLDKVYFALQEFKSLKGWYNLQIPREKLADLLVHTPGKDPWYTIFVPKREMSFDDVANGHLFDRIAQWQEMVEMLLQKYAERLYVYSRKEWETPRLKYRDITPEDNNFKFPQSDDGKESGYIFTLEETDSFLEELKKVKQAIKEEKLRDWPFDGRNLRIFHWDNCLYTPLICISKRTNIKVKPVALNQGETQFVQDLRDYYKSHEGFFKDKDLYMLRNRSKSGIGFFEEGGFYPDFILWLIAGDKQYITFVDPKGIRNLPGELDPKIGFSTKIKELEARLGDPNVVLNSFIISSTQFTDIKHWGMSKEDLEEQHVLFEPDGKGYIRKLVELQL